VFVRAEEPLVILSMENNSLDNPHRSVRESELVGDREDSDDEPITTDAGEGGREGARRFSMALQEGNEIC
jgi:hypothetical protein